MNKLLALESRGLELEMKAEEHSMRRLRQGYAGTTWLGMMIKV